MTTYNLTRDLQSNGAGLFSRLGDRLGRYRVYRSTYDELSNLSDRELDDLGISKFNIRAIAYKTAYGG